METAKSRPMSKDFMGRVHGPVRAEETLKSTSEVIDA